MLNIMYFVWPTIMFTDIYYSFTKRVKNNFHAKECVFWASLQKNDDKIFNELSPKTLDVNVKLHMFTPTTGGHSKSSPPLINKNYYLVRTTELAHSRNSLKLAPIFS